VSLKVERQWQSDPDFYDCWNWWRAHLGAEIVRDIRAKAKLRKPLWIFILSWWHGRQHGQDPLMFNDAGVSLLAPMLYQVPNRTHFNIMVKDWNEYLRAGQVNLRDSYAIVRNGELWLINSHIAPYDPASRQNHEPRRNRKLLMHRRQINRLEGQVQERGYTLVPLRMYLRGSKAKVELALARGKRQYDKRETIAKREAGRQIERALKEQTQKRTRE